MLLLDRTGAKPDAYTRIETADDSAAGPKLAPLALIDALASEETLGALVENTVRAEALAPYFDRLALIAIRFPAGTDGRGFSLARQVRRLGFTGVLRASGPLFPDQFPQALACGFDEVEIPDASAARQPVAHWLDALNRVTLSYQRDYGQGERILDRRARS